MVCFNFSQNSNRTRLELYALLYVSIYYPTFNPTTLWAFRPKFRLEERLR